jgi:hypothetical protein
MIWHIQTDYTALLLSSIHLQVPCLLSSFLTSPFNYFAYVYFTGARAYSGQAGSSSETSVNVLQTIICHIPDDSILHTSNLHRYKSRLLKYVFQFLGEFAKLWTATISVVMSVRLFVRPHATTRPLLDRLPWNLMWDYFSKICPDFQVSSQSDKNKGYFTWRPMYIYGNISFSSS